MADRLHTPPMTVTLASDDLAPFRRVSLYNSPYVAHDDGRAVDLYPPAGAESIPSPVSGAVLETRTVRAPPQSYAEPEDHLVLVDTGAQVARLMHVEPVVEAGDVLACGDSLGRPVRAGFFAPWVPNHLHLEFRPPDVDPYRASGSLRLGLDVDVTPLAWDGTGTVVETGEAWARLDRPAHPSPGTGFAGLACDVGGEERVVLDGGLPHYDSGGLLGTRIGSPGGSAAVRLAGQRVGTADGRDVAWHDVRVLANGDPVRGVACYADRETTGVKLVGQEVALAEGETVTVEISTAE
jgi:hypothetical protein